MNEIKVEFNYALVTSDGLTIKTVFGIFTKNLKKIADLTVLLDGLNSLKKQKWMLNDKIFEGQVRKRKDG